MGECRSQICTVGLVTGLFLAWGDLMGECRSQDESPETLMWTVRPLLEMNENNKCIWLLVTTCKRSLGQGNIFTCICHSVHNGEWVSVWCHFLSGFLIPCSFWGYLSLLPCYCLVVSVWECFCLGCLCLGGSLCRGMSVGRPPQTETLLYSGHVVCMHPTGMLTCSWLHWVGWMKLVGKLTNRNSRCAVFNSMDWECSCMQCEMQLTFWWNTCKEERRCIQNGMEGARFPVHICVWFEN